MMLLMKILLRPKIIITFFVAQHDKRSEFSRTFHENPP